MNIKVLCIIAIITNIIAIACSVSALLYFLEQIERLEINLYKKIKAYFDEKQFNEEMKRLYEKAKKQKRGRK